jgi:transposase-like protein
MMRSYISHRTINNLFLEWAGENAPSLYETSVICRPSWSGHLQVDGKHLLVNNKWIVLLVAVDIYTLDVPMTVLCHDENKAPFQFIIKSLLKLKYPFKSITTDLGKGFVKEARKLLPEIPHQVCAIHLQRYIDQRVPKRPKKDKEIILGFRHLAQELLQAKNLANYERKLSEFKAHGLKGAKTHPGCRVIYNAILRYQDSLKQHYKDDNIQNNSNSVECVISHLSEKIYQVKKFESFPGAYYTTTLSTIYWRLHQFTCSRYKERNGKSPLLLAQSQQDVHGHWIDVVLNIKNQSECINVAEYHRRPIYISKEGFVDLKDRNLIDYGKY